jgi:predicted ATPase/DNA-binding SARP family transcriptional activator
VGKAVAKGGHLDVRLFGHVEVALEGAPFRLATPRRTLAVLAYLLLHRGAAVSREYLSFLLYPDDEEGAARAKLRATLAEIPKILPSAGDYVTIDADKVMWNPDADVWLDVDEFVEASNDRSRLADAVELYRGDLLPEVYDEWLDAIRERHRNAYLRCLTERVSEARRNADPALAIETARKVLAVDPWREDVVRRIIAMRYESGDGAGALREYNEFVSRLRAELGAEPMAETAAVAERISRGEAPDDEARDLDAPAMDGRSTVLPFVGRRAEMERLLETWSRVARGRGACAFVGGESGIGKSRLALEFAHAVEDRGGRVLKGSTSLAEAVPYESFADAVRSALPLVAALKRETALAAVATLVPEIHARVSLPSLPQLDAESERLRLFESLFRCLADLAAQRPLLLVLEDLHWAEAASLELLRFLLRRVAGVPLMIVATYNDDETPHLHAFHRLRREARATTGAQSMWLPRLNYGDVEMLRTRLPDVLDRSADALIAASHGNPLFLTELVVEVRAGDREAVPSSLEEIVSRRLERLSENARTAAEIAACIGDRFSRDALREVSAWDEMVLSDALDELLDRRIVCEAGGRGIFEYAFTHHLVQDAIARSLQPERAAVRRRRIARVLERLYPERFPELSPALAAHYESAGDAANAARCYLEAARRSIAIGALQEARAQCARGLALDAAPKARADLLLESVAIESRCGDLTSRAEALEALERIDAELADPELHRAALLQRIEFALTTGDRVAHERAVAELRALLYGSDARSNAEVHLAEARLAYALGHLAAAYAAGEAALLCARDAGDDAATVRALCSMAEVEAHRGHLPAANALFDEAASIAARAADPVLELLSLRSGWPIAYQRRDIARCRSLSERCLELAVKLVDRPAEAQAHGRLGIALAAVGENTAKAREHFAIAARISGENGNLAGTAAALMNEALLESRLGFFERALDATEKAAELFARSSDARGRIAALANLVFLNACVDKVPAARQAADEALGLARRLGFGMLEPSILENLAYAEAASGDYARAIEMAEKAFELRSHSESLVWARKTLADVALWYAAVGNIDAARDAVTRLLVDDDGITRGTEWPSYCYWAAAQVFRRDGNSAEAKRALDKAKRLMQTSAVELEGEDRERFLSLPWHVALLQTTES